MRVSSIFARYLVCAALLLAGWSCSLFSSKPKPPVNEPVAASKVDEGVGDAVVETPATATDAGKGAVAKQGSVTADASSPAKSDDALDAEGDVAEGVESEPAVAATPAAAPAVAATPTTVATTPVEAVPVAESAAVSAEPSHAEGQDSDGFVTYFIAKGDTLSKIAQKVYGDKFKWQMIAKATGNIKNPNRIFPGDVIKIPLVDKSSKNFGAKYSKKMEASKVTEVVTKGETLAKLAKKDLGNSQNWKQIWQQNKHLVKNPNKIFVGEKLTFSVSAAAGIRAQ